MNCWVWRRSSTTKTINLVGFAHSEKEPRLGPASRPAPQNSTKMLILPFFRGIPCKNNDLRRTQRLFWLRQDCVALSRGDTACVMTRPAWFMCPQSALRGLSGVLGREQRNPMGPEKGAEIALDCDPHTPLFGDRLWRDSYSKVLRTQSPKFCMRYCLLRKEPCPSVFC